MYIDVYYSNRALIQYIIFWNITKLNSLDLKKYFKNKSLIRNFFYEVFATKQNGNIEEKKEMANKIREERDINILFWKIMTFLCN